MRRIFEQKLVIGRAPIPFARQAVSPPCQLDWQEAKFGSEQSSAPNPRYSHRPRNLHTPYTCIKHRIILIPGGYCGLMENLR